MQRLIVPVAVAMLFSVEAATKAKTLVFEGGLSSHSAIRQQLGLRADKSEADSFMFHFPLQADYQNKSVNRPVDSIPYGIPPQSAISSIEQDQYCNSFQKVVWNNLANHNRINTVPLENSFRKPEFFRINSGFPIY